MSLESPRGNCLALKHTWTGVRVDKAKAAYLRLAYFGNHFLSNF